MSDFVIYGVPGSPFMRAVQAGLEEKGQPYRIQVLGPGETKTPGYLEKHPFGRVPVIEHDDFRLYETQAILRYIDDIVPSPPLVPKDPRAAARMNQIIGINDWYLFPKAAAAIAFQRIIGPVLMGLKPDEAVIASALPMAKTCFTELDRLLGTQTFLTGETLSIADLMLAPQLYFLALTPEGRGLIKDTRRLEAWLTRMLERPSMKATEPPEALRKAA